MTRRTDQILTVIALALVWTLLWGTFSWANLIGGVLVAVVLLAVFPLPPVTFGGRLRPLPLLRLVGRFLYDLVVASVQIAWLAVRIGPPPRSAIIAVPLRINTDLNLTLTAEALSLVPGSLILDVDRAAGVLYIHVLGVRDGAAVERFRRDVLALEGRIVAAVGSTEEYRRLRRSAPAIPPDIR